MVCRSKFPSCRTGNSISMIREFQRPRWLRTGILRCHKALARGSPIRPFDGKERRILRRSMAGGKPGIEHSPNGRIAVFLDLRERARISHSSLGARRRHQTTQLPISAYIGATERFQNHRRDRERLERPSCAFLHALALRQQFHLCQSAPERDPRSARKREALKQILTG